MPRPIFGFFMPGKIPYPAVHRSGNRADRNGVSGLPIGAVHETKKTEHAPEEGCTLVCAHFDPDNTQAHMDRL